MGLQQRQSYYVLKLGFFFHFCNFYPWNEEFVLLVLNKESSFVLRNLYLILSYYHPSFLVNNFVPRLIFCAFLCTHRNQAIRILTRESWRFMLQVRWIIYAISLIEFDLWLKEKDLLYYHLFLYVPHVGPTLSVRTTDCSIVCLSEHVYFNIFIVFSPNKLYGVNQ